jgi:dienelactone hydrolase
MPCRLACRVAALLVLATMGHATSALAAEPIKPDPARGDRMLAEYFRLETARLSDACLAEVKTLKDWQANRGEYRRQLFDMLGLDPLPERTDLAAVVTGKVEEEEFLVERVHFQSRPQLYVTGNLYLPKTIDKPLPAVLYVCGHSMQKKDGVSYGNKVGYQHHGAWLARHGYVCLTIDSLQLGEIEGIHHGTHRYGMWWWLNRGYTPAGVEAWNCIRALDYLQARPEVDGERLGVTGRSGGGAYSWWVATLDDRIQAAVPVAGVTDLTNHVVDGCVEGHCDCMYINNTYRWDYPLVAALVAPRPLLISNTDRDPIFPLDGVVRTYYQARRIYELAGAADKLAFNIAAGPHKDTQELQVHAFRWLDAHLRGDSRLLEKPAVPFFQPEQLRVFKELPADQINTRIHETFVPAAPPPAVPADQAEWESARKAWIAGLEQKTFRAWPAKPGALNLKPAFTAERHGVRLAAYDFTSQGPFELRLYVAQRAGLPKADLVVLNVLDETDWSEFLATYRPAFADELKDETLPEADEKSFEETRRMFANFPWAMAYVAPRGIGPTAWNPDDRKQTQIRRRYMLLGQTLDGMRVWDARRSIQAVREAPLMKDVPLWLQAERQMAGIALYASLFERDVARLDLHDLPANHRHGPILLNVNRVLEMPQAVAMAAERSRVVLYQPEEAGWEYPQAVAKALEWDAKKLQIRTPAKEKEKQNKTP